MDAAQFETYEDESARWRWRLRAKNGEIVAMATESYRDETDARRAVGDSVIAMHEAEVEPIVARASAP
jgi:uncharacterized protein YegP (UPF0339 family)